MSIAVFIELAYLHREKLKPVLKTLHPHEIYRVGVKPAGKFASRIFVAVMPNALFNPAPSSKRSAELQALARRTSAKKRQAKE